MLHSVPVPLPPDEPAADAARAWRDHLRAQGELLDGIDVALCAFDLEDRTVAWNASFVRLFPEHADHVHEGEPYVDNLRRFYRKRLSPADHDKLPKYIEAGLARHRMQAQPFFFEHEGKRIQVSSVPVAGRGRIRVWRTLDAPGVTRHDAETFSPDAELLEGMPEGLVVCDAQGRLLWANPMFRTLYAAESMPFLRFAPLGEIYAHGWEAERGCEAHLRGAALLRANIAKPGEPFELPLPGGRCCRVIARPARGGHVFFAHIDISALKRYEADLQLTLDHAGRGIYRVDAQGRVILYNAKLLELLELPEPLLASRPLLEEIIRFQEARGDFRQEFLSPDLRARFDRHSLAQDLIAALDAKEQYLRRTAAGRFIEVATQRLPDGGMVRMVSDVTSYVDAQEALREKTGALQLALDSMSQGISAMDGDGRFFMWNRRYQELLDLPDELMASRPTMQSVLRFQVGRGDFGPDYAFVDESARNYVATGDVMPPLRGPETYLRQSIDGRWLEVHTRPLPGGGAVRTFTDVTEHVQSRDALSQAKEVAQEASRAKSRFLSSMSHEIRTPMNAVLGMLTLLRSTSLSQRQEDYAAKAEGAARSLLSLLNDILDFSKIEAGKMHLDCRPFSLEATLSELSVILSTQVGGRGIEVLYDLDPRVPDTLVGDDMRLRQILINLGGNAVKFTERGQVVLRTCLVGLDEGHATVEFAVEDSGIGISPEEQQKLFSDFVQATDQTARTFGGTGLGLGICRRLAELMGGSLQLESATGVGSRFWFSVRLPVAAAQAVHEGLPGVSRVLVVDDNEIARECLAGIATAEGWRVETAAGGEEGLARIREATRAGRPYDAIFIDWRMPGMDGWATSMRIRALPAGGRVPLVVMVTAQGRELFDGRPAEEQSLVDGLVVKPVTGRMLREAIARAMDRPRAGVAARPAAPAATPLRGLRLLLAEDNAINQQIAVELLTAEGAEVDVVGDGLLAVARIEAGQRYDAVLMDMLMPAMGGVEATREIRGRLGERALPIIAMTANAMDSDRAECLEAGMNDHVGKPVVMADVVDAILRHVARFDRADAAPAVPKALPLLDREGAIARLAGNVALFERLLPIFRANLEKSVTEMRAAIAAGAHDDVCRLMHTIKGMAGNVGAVALSAAAAVAEAQLRSAGVAPAEAAMPVELAIDRTLAVLPAA